MEMEIVLQADELLLSSTVSGRPGEIPTSDEYVFVEGDQDSPHVVPSCMD
jgi:hypothetical protein